jgi:hypothetical protein
MIRLKGVMINDDMKAGEEISLWISITLNRGSCSLGLGKAYAFKSSREISVTVMMRSFEGLGVNALAGHPIRVSPMSIEETPNCIPSPMIIREKRKTIIPTRGVKPETPA